MAQYYYLAASLPLLRLNETTRIKTSEFLADCERLVAPGDLAVLRSAQLGATSDLPSQTPILKRFQEMEFGLRNELVKLRAKKAGIDAETHLRRNAENPLMAGQAREVFEEASPLRSEIRMIEMLWAFLDDLSVGHPFDLECLIVFYLKLQLLERKSLFQIENGKNKLESILSGETNNG